MSKLKEKMKDSYQPKKDEYFKRIKGSQLLELIEDEDTRFWTSLVVGSIGQGVMDSLLRSFAECSCVQGKQRCLVAVAECCGKIGIFIQLVQALTASP